jgi:precorrin-2 dehydrogenase/sirohydrochlorin ferrochelatase
MYPVIYPPARLHAVLVGAGEAAVRRLKGLDAAGITVQVFSSEPGGVLAKAAGERCTARLLHAADLEGLPGVTLLLVAGLDDDVSTELAALARARAIPVNVEDRPALCDFHVPAVIRRGELLLTVSTGGGAPGLAGRLRQRLEDDFGPEWGGRLDALAQARTKWKADGADMAELRRRTREWLDQRGWFD